MEITNYTIAEQLIVDGFVEIILKRKKFSAGYLSNVDAETLKDISSELKLSILEYFFENKEKNNLDIETIKGIIYKIVEFQVQGRITGYGKMYKKIWQYLDNKSEFNEKDFYEGEENK